MKITVLGCGASGGVPLIGNRWGDCDPNEPRNRRSRPSILVETAETSLLVDTGPDMRMQLLRENVTRLDGVIYTHAHADHTHGIDDLRSVNWMTRQPLPIFADAETLASLQQRFDYCFRSPAPNFFLPSLLPEEITGPWTFKDLHIQPFVQDHGFSTSLGFRFGDFAYSTDVKRLDEAAFAALEGVKLWIVDAASYEQDHPVHANLAQAMAWIERLKPERAFLTHMNQTMDYARLCAELPAHVRPAYDGLILEL